VVEWDRHVSSEMSSSRILSALAVLCMFSLAAQTIAQETKPTSILSVRALADGGAIAVEIISSQPLTPTISKVENPSRLVIDLPSGVIPADKRLVDFHSSLIKAVRLNQFKISPPVTRIVVDLAKPATFSWEASGNLLTVRIHAAESARPVVPVPVAARSSTSIQLAGTRVPAGSSVTAGFDTAVLHLPKGGEVRVCPGTTVSISSSQNSSALMLGMSTGALETHYALDAASDSILTPDFRLLLTGPGEFNYAINVDSHGDTCVQALPGNTASIVASELMGDGTYQVKPTQQVMFRAGRLNASDTIPPGGCGCPPDMPQMKLASSAPKEATAALVPTKADDVHVRVEAPIVFRAAGPPEPAIAEVKILPIRDLPRSAYIDSRPLPPPRHGFFSKLKGFFSSIFG